MINDANLLRAFVMVAELGSFTLAATQLFRSQSAVSLQIKRLESATGCILLERDSHHVFPTEEGKAFLIHAKNVLEALSQLDDYVSGKYVNGAVCITEFASLLFNHYELEQLCSLIKRGNRSFSIVSLDEARHCAAQDDFAVVLLEERSEFGSNKDNYLSDVHLVSRGDGGPAAAEELPLIISPSTADLIKFVNDHTLRARLTSGPVVKVPSMSASVRLVQAGVGQALLPASHELSACASSGKVVGSVGIRAAIDVRVGGVERGIIKKVLSRASRSPTTQES